MVLEENMDGRVRTRNNSNDKALLRETSVSVAIEPSWDMHDAWSQKDFNTWLDAFRDRYAEALEYLREH